jgi:hypothetical protein
VLVTGGLRKYADAADEKKTVQLGKRQNRKPPVTTVKEQPEEKHEIDT